MLFDVLDHVDARRQRDRLARLRTLASAAANGTLDRSGLIAVGTHSAPNIDCHSGIAPNDVVASVITGAHHIGVHLIPFRAVAAAGHHHIALKKNVPVGQDGAVVAPSQSLWPN